MPRQLTITDYCDPCFAEGQHSEAAEFNIALGELGINKPRTILLCERHRKEHYDGLRDLLRDYGSTKPLDATPASSGRKKGRPSTSDLTCSLCGHTSPNRAALASHTRNMHDQNLAVMEGQPANYECPECHNTFVRPQGLAAHRRSTHGVEGATAVKADPVKKATAKKRGGSRKAAAANDATLV